MSRNLPASGPAGGGAPRSDPLTPALTTVTLQYHTVPPEKLVAKTVAGLINAGLPSAALGRVAGMRVTITGRILLNPMAREHLPPQLGGGGAQAFEGSAATLDLVDKSYRNSPMASRRPAPSPFTTPLKGLAVGGVGGGGCLGLPVGYGSGSTVSRPRHRALCLRTRPGPGLHGPGRCYPGNICAYWRPASQQRAAAGRGAVRRWRDRHNRTERGDRRRCTPVG